MSRGPILDPDNADENGLVAVGGDLRPARLVEAYARGVFPWYNDGDPVLWWSPDPRGIIDLDALHVPRRLRRTLNGGRFGVSLDVAFAAVIRACADRPRTGTWITAEMIAAYEELHRLGFAHSLEAWHE